MIHVRCSCGACQEWALIELQGEIERSDGDDVLDGLDVGTLCKTAPSTLSLTVGYHQVEGKLSTLRTPLAILRRVGGDAGGEAALAYEVVGVIRHKYHFKTRPKALISKPDPAKRQKTEQHAAMRGFFNQGPAVAPAAPAVASEPPGAAEQ